jgi:hypothetical protein
VFEVKQEFKELPGPVFRELPELKGSKEQRVFREFKGPPVPEFKEQQEFRVQWDRLEVRD